MAQNIVNPLSCYNKPLTPALAGSTDTINTTDHGRFTFASSNHHILAQGSSLYRAYLISGYIAKINAASSGGSTVPFYIRKLDPSDELEVTYSTVVGSTTYLHPATTDIGKYIGFSTVATVAGAVLDCNNLGDAPGTSDARFLQISGFSTNRRKITGFPVANSSVIAW